MNSQTYEQVALSSDAIGDAKFLLQDSMPVEVSVFNEQPIAVKLPKTVILTVVANRSRTKGCYGNQCLQACKNQYGSFACSPTVHKDR